MAPLWAHVTGRAFPDTNEPRIASRSVADERLRPSTNRRSGSREVQMTDPALTTAIYVIVALLMALAVWLLIWWQMTPYTLRQFGIYLGNLFFTRVMWRTKVVGTLDVPENQGAVIVCNHQSGIDPLLIQLCGYRIVHWLVAREYYNMFGISFLFRQLKSIPVNRGGIDTAATKMAIRYAQEGGLVGLFPEGRVNTTDALLLPGRPGAALIALSRGCR